MTTTTLLNQWTLEDFIEVWINAFLVDRKAQNVSPGTLKFYNTKLGLFADYCESQQVKQISQITPTMLREFLLYLEEHGHNPGGIHACFRSVRTLLNWFEQEMEPEGWKNPIHKVKAPKVPQEILEPADISDVQRMIDTCKTDFLGRRDKAIFLFLLDTGVRASELLAIRRDEINLITGQVLIRMGKGRKPRFVYLGQKARKVLRAYVKTRHDECPYLFTSDNQDKLSYWGLKMMVRRRAKQARVKTPQVHAFRRWFALNYLRSGGDVYSLAGLMGHSPSSVQVLFKYLKLTENDLRMSHDRTSLVDDLNH